MWPLRVNVCTQWASATKVVLIFLLIVPIFVTFIQGSDEEESDGGFGGKKPIAASGQKGQEQQEGSGLSRAGRSGALPGVHAPPSTTAAAAVRGSHFDALLNNSDDSNENSSNPPRARTSVGGKEGGFEGKKKQAAVPGITARMQELDSQIEEMERDDPAGHLAQLRKAHEEQQRQNSDGGGDDDDNSVASEDIDAMEFSTGGGAGDDSESSGEGSFSFLDSSSKK